MNTNRVAVTTDAFQQWPESVREKTRKERIRATNANLDLYTRPWCPSNTLPAKENGELLFCIAGKIWFVSRRIRDLPAGITHEGP